MLEFLRNRGVQHLVHFTRIDNLPSVLRSGLLSRDELQAQEIRHSYNDPYRFDHLSNGTCLSITFPNYKMFYRLRQEHPEQDWAVLRIDPAIVSHKRCVFNYENAASKQLSTLSAESRMGIEALRGMFSDHDGMPSRSTLRIPENLPTNPQAEILVLDHIEPRYILEVAIDTKDRVRDMNSIIALAKEHNGAPRFVHDRSLFDARVDYAHWRAQQNG